MLQTDYEQKIKDLGSYKCATKKPKNRCVGTHTCEFILKKKFFKNAVVLNLRDARSKNFYQRVRFQQK